jgi:hypothetical protein
MGEWRAVENTLSQLIDLGYFTAEQGKQALESLSLVRPMQFEQGQVVFPNKYSRRVDREAAYKPYNMVSLID